MSLNFINQRDTELPDFRVTFVGFEAGGARIAVGIKERSTLVHNLLVEPTVTNPSIVTYSPWDDFYSRIEPGPTLNSIPDDEISRYTPGTPVGPTYTYPTDRLKEGGEFVIPIDTEIYFWVHIPGQFQKNEQGDIRNSFIGYPYLGQFDRNAQGNNLRIEFGTSVPADTPFRKNQTTEVWSYAFNLPIFKVRVSAQKFDLQMYDIGECVFIDEKAARQGNLLNFKRASSYYD